MAHGDVLTTDEKIDAALERAMELEPRTRALTAEYHSAADMIVFQLSNGRRLLIPREELQGLESATPSQLAHIELHNGLGISWPELDVDHYLPDLLEGCYGSDRWMKSLQRYSVAA